MIDSDQPGREAGKRIARDLTAIGLKVTVADLHPDRDDGSDLTDWLFEHAAAEPAARLALLQHRLQTAPAEPAARRLVDRARSPISHSAG